MRKGIDNENSIYCKETEVKLNCLLENTQFINDECMFDNKNIM